MKKNELYVYLALSLAILIPLPGRFAYGVITVLTLYILTLLGILFRKLSSMFFEYGIHCILITAMLISTSVLLRQVLILICPYMAFIMGINFYVSAFSAFVMGNLYRQTVIPVKDSIKIGVAKCSAFGAFALIFFLIRDVFGYRTITLPGTDGLNEVTLFEFNSVSFIGSFFASIPGAVILLAVLISSIASLMKHFEIIATARTEEGAGND